MSYKGDYSPMDLLKKLEDYPPDYVPPNRGDFLTAFSIASTTFALFIISTRLATRKFISNGIDISDWLMVASGLLMLGGTVAWIIGIKQGVIGMHLIDTLANKTFLEFFTVEKKVVFTLKLIFAYQIHYLITLLLIKLSLLFFYRRLLGSTHRTIRNIIHTTVCALIIYTIISVILLSFQCAPQRAYWTPTLHHKQCPHWTKMRRLYIGILSISVISDFWVLLLPTTFIFRLSKLPLKRKLEAIAIFTIGTAACAAAVVRIFLSATKEMYKDITWDFALMIFWGQLEMSVAIMCACLPSLKMLWCAVAEKKGWRKSIAGSSEGSGSGTQTLGGRRVPEKSSYSDSASEMESGSISEKSVTPPRTAVIRDLPVSREPNSTSDSDSIHSVPSLQRPVTAVTEMSCSPAPLSPITPFDSPATASEFEKWERTFSWDGDAVGSVVPALGKPAK